MPFGRGKDGAATINTDTNTRATVIGTATSPNITIGTAILSNGDVFLIHQTMGTGAGQWEVNRVKSGGGTTSIVCQTALQNTYVAGAQVIKFNEYSTAIVTAHSTTPWDYTTNIGGVEVICAKRSITISGAWNCAAKGFIGGGSDNTDQEYAGNGTVGLTVKQAAANGNGGGGGRDSTDIGSGGGGGSNAGAGNNGTAGTYVGGTGASPVGSSDLITMDLGGGGGGGGTAHVGEWKFGGNGGNGGGILICITKDLTVSAGVSLNGGDGTTGQHADVGGGGGGAGGSFLGIVNTATLGTLNITAIKGSGGVTNASGGDGGDGRIAIHHSSTVAGTTNPTFTDVSDLSLYELNAGAIFAALIQLYI